MILLFTKYLIFADWFLNRNMYLVSKIYYLIRNLFWAIPSLHFILDFFFSYIFYQVEFLQNISENCAYLINNMVSLENISNFILYINIIYWSFIVFFIFAQITFKFNHHTYIVFFLLFETIRIKVPYNLFNVSMNRLATCSSPSLAIAHAYFQRLWL